MRWITAIAGLVILVLLQDAQALPRKQWKRSIDLNDVYDSKIRQHVISDVIPTQYDLELQPFIGNDKFSGRVKINVTWNLPTNQITLHVHPSLEIIDTSVKITQGSFEERKKGWPVMDVNVAKIEHSVKREPLYYINLEQMLTEGTSCEVVIKFTGKLTTNETSGLFKNEYIDSNGDSHPFVATYLRPNHAHRVFPCLDYNQYKATYKLSVLRPKNMTARSNTPVKSTTDATDMPDQVWDHFEETPQMSTYQLALVVSDFESISPTKEMNEIDEKKLEIKVWGRKEYLNTLKDVPDKVVTIMNYLQDYFNMSILLPKLDLMAIPSYHATKASDSWGLMLFKESELSGPSYWLTAYELLYQWIGQYITPSYWSQAPVNKALNSFLASLTTVNLNPIEMDGKWPMTILYSLYYEFGKTVPFSRVAGIRCEAMSSKEELTFRMFNCTLGKDVFQRGIRNFVRQISEEPQRAFFERQIYDSLNDVANETGNLPIGLTISSIAGPWINRGRVPLVTVIRDYETKTITFSQKVYLREATPASTSKAVYQWDIPLVMISETNRDMYKPCNLWLRNTKVPTNLTIPDTVGGDNYIIVNPEEIGMFPVNYDSHNWKMLSAYLQGPKRETIPDLTRAKLLHDSWNLAYAGELYFGIALNMTLSLKEERSHVVWEPVFMMIDHIGRRIEGSDVYPKFEAYIRTLLKPLYTELNELVVNNEPSWKTHMRSLAKHFLCRAGYKPCVEEARNQYKKWLMDEDPDKGNPVANEFICPVFKWGSAEEWEFGLQRVINFPQNSPERKQNERTYLLKTLAGCPKDTNKIERLLNVTILDQNGNFTDSDIYLIFSTLTGGAAGYTTLFNFLSDHWDTIRQRFENKKHLWDGIINSATSSFNTQEGFEMVSELYMNRQGEFDTADHIIEEALKIIEQETEWSEKNLPVIDAWLNENLPKEELEALQTSTATIMMTSVTAEEKKDEEL
ncbi:aminopeptidase N isoform X2 [Nomia melanderi]|nr:aminopeptidase N isoform X2 [Nomia melanderi]XP_031844215.1 aminopeptidase N isoform X2 [Nomia melanderi]XP_031844216.1 aminopeptidase N isoform X2 [Nomia melanderi]